MLAVQTLQEEHEEQVRESQDLEANQRNLDASYSEMKQMRMDLENLSLALHKEKSDLEVLILRCSFLWLNCFA